MQTTSFYFNVIDRFPCADPGKILEGEGGWVLGILEPEA